MNTRNLKCSPVISLKDGLYAKVFNNGICKIEGKPYTFKNQAKTRQLIKIKNGKPYLTDCTGEAIEELVPITPDGGAA